MAIIRPFKALRPTTELAQQVASRPYDVLNSEEAKIEAKDNPYSFLHITKPEIDLPEAIDVHSTAVYEKAKDNLEQFIYGRHFIQRGKTLLLYLPVDHEWKKPDRFGLCFIGG